MAHLNHCGASLYTMRFSTLCALAALGALLGCAALARSGAPPSAKPEDAADLLQRLRVMEAGATCKSQADCRTLPIGARLCGGPAAWLAMSSAQMDEARPLAERLTALNKASNAVRAASGENSTCQVVPEPAVGCVAGYCRILPSGPSGRAD